MKYNREAALAALKTRIILPEEDYETILDAVEDGSESYSEKIAAQANVLRGGSIDDVTDAAVERSFENANPEWREMALEVVRQTCERKYSFTVNDFRKILQQSGIETHDNRSVGGLMRTAQARGWCKPSGETIKSKVGHKSPLQIWESLLYNNSI